MAIICRKYNLLFIMRGGTGCSSVGKVLIDRFDGSMLPEENIFENGRMVLGRKHNDVHQLLNWGYLSRNDLENLFIFTTIRNPYDAVASEYARVVSEWEGNMPRDAQGNMIEDETVRNIIRQNAAHARQIGFDGWVKLRHGRLPRLKAAVKSKVFGYRPTDYLAYSDFVMRFENLQEDFQEVLRLKGIASDASLPNTNPTSGKQPYRDYYTTYSQKIVTQKFSDIIDRFNYSF